MREVNVTIQDWHFSCGDPNCCDEYGTTLTVNGVHITDNYEGYESDIVKTLEAVGITAVISETEDNE